MHLGKAHAKFVGIAAASPKLEKLHDDKAAVLIPGWAAQEAFSVPVNDGCL